MTNFLQYIDAYKNIEVVTPETNITSGSTPIVVPSSNPPAGDTSNTPSDITSLLGFSDSGNNIYIGEQQVLNADRIILNAKRNFLFLFANRGIGLSANQSINLESGNDIILYPYSKLLIGVPEKVDNHTTEQKQTGAPKDKSYEAIPLGNKLSSLLEDLITALMQTKVSTPTGEGLISSETQYALQKLYARIPEILSTIAFIDGTKHQSIPGPLPSFPSEENSAVAESITYETTISGSSSPVNSGSFNSPVQSGRITSIPGNRTNPVTGTPQNHGGLDIANVPGTPIYAIADGEVLRTNDGCVVGDKSCGGKLGNYVVIKHVGGIEAKYGHMQQNSILVHQGDFVLKGQQIGSMGNTGASTGTHLHIQTKALPGSEYSSRIMPDAASPGLINPLDLFNV
mgnify:CR=1 FL=1